MFAADSYGPLGSGTFEEGLFNFLKHYYTIAKMLSMQLWKRLLEYSEAISENVLIVDTI